LPSHIPIKKLLWKKRRLWFFVIKKESIRSCSRGMWRKKKKTFSKRCQFVWTRNEKKHSIQRISQEQQKGNESNEQVENQ
jgi:hypothetical protein